MIVNLLNCVMQLPIKLSFRCLYDTVPADAYVWRGQDIKQTFAWDPMQKNIDFPLNLCYFCRNSNLKSWSPTSNWQFSQMCWVFFCFCWSWRTITSTPTWASKFSLEMHYNGVYRVWLGRYMFTDYSYILSF